MAEILWAQSSHGGPHSKGEKKGAWSQADRDLQSTPAPLILESLAMPSDVSNTHSDDLETYMRVMLFHSFFKRICIFIVSLKKSFKK